MLKSPDPKNRLEVGQNDIWFRVKGLGLGFWVLGFEVHGLRSGLWGLGFGVQGMCCWVGFGVQGVHFRLMVWRFGAWRFGVEKTGFMVLGRV
mmetsp:Transcript_41815/g.65325  ORF Transcript_41815/g.65325 Transcript_41815/m.65325 type:complete len:92 (-) Transcript_41815:630-905(-)